MKTVLLLIGNVFRKTGRIIAKMRFRDGHQWAGYLKKKRFLYDQGVDCYIDFSVKFEEPYLNRLGNNVWLTDDVILLNHDGALSMLNRYSGQRANKFGAIEMGNNVFVGMRSLIMPGVKIGNNVIVAAGSVVTRSIPANTIYGGNPAVQIGRTNSFLEKWRGALNFAYRNSEEKKQELMNHFWMEKTHESTDDHRPISTP